MKVHFNINGTQHLIFQTTYFLNAILSVSKTLRQCFTENPDFSA